MKALNIREMIEALQSREDLECTESDSQLFCSPPHTTTNESLTYFELTNGMDIFIAENFRNMSPSLELKSGGLQGELLFVFSGALEVSSGDEVYSLLNQSSGQMIVSSNFERRYRRTSEQGISSLSLYFDAEPWRSFLELIDGIPSVNSTYQFDLSPLCFAALDFTHHLSSCTYSCDIKRLFIEAKATELLARCINLIEQRNASIDRSVKEVRRGREELQLAKTLIEQRLDDPPSLAQLSRDVGINEYKLKVGFKQMFGTTVYGFIRQERMRRAAQLLIDSDDTISEVAQQLGYSNFSHFARAFKEVYGKTPRDYRRKLAR